MLGAVLGLFVLVALAHASGVTPAHYPTIGPVLPYIPLAPILFGSVNDLVKNDPERAARADRDADRADRCARARECRTVGACTGRRGRSPRPPSRRRCARHGHGDDAGQEHGHVAADGQRRC